MKRLILLVALVAPLACQHASIAPHDDAESEAAVVQRDVRAMNDALFSGDADVLVQHTLPAVVKKWGGPEAYSKIYMAVAKTQAKAGIKLESFTFPSPPEFIAGQGERRFALVPTRIIVTDGTNRGGSTGFQLGVKEPGAAEWKYIPGFFVRPDLLAELAPDFPVDHPLPPRSTEKLPARKSP